MSVPADEKYTGREIMKKREINATSFRGDERYLMWEEIFHMNLSLFSIGERMCLLRMENEGIGANVCCREDGRYLISFTSGADSSVVTDGSFENAVNSACAELQLHRLAQQGPDVIYFSSREKTPLEQKAEKFFIETEKDFSEATINASLEKNSLCISCDGNKGTKNSVFFLKEETEEKNKEKLFTINMVNHGVFRSSENVAVTQEMEKNLLSIHLNRLKREFFDAVKKGGKVLAYNCKGMGLKEVPRGTLKQVGFAFARLILPSGVMLVPYSHGTGRSFGWSYYEEKEKVDPEKVNLLEWDILS